MRPRLNILITHRYVVAATMQRGRQVGSVNAHAAHGVDAPLTLHEGVDWSEMVSAIADVTRRLDTHGQPGNLIIPSSWCYMCQLEQPEKRFNADAAAFEMEDYIPVPLERVTTAFVPCAESCIGIAVLTEPLETLLQELDKRGVRIDHLWVDVIVAAANPEQSESNRTVTVRDVGRSAVMQASNNGATSSMIRNTLVGAANDAAANWHITTDGSEESGSSGACFDLSILPDDSNGHVSHHGDTDGRNKRLGALDLISTAVADGRIPNLRVGALALANRFDGLYRHAIRVASLALVLMAVLLIDGYRMRQDVAKRIGAVRDEQRQIYRASIPDGTMPPNPATRIASERKRIEALASTSSSDSAIPAAARAQPLDDLRVFVEALPSDVRILVNELVADAGQFNLRGHTASHRDAERIADAVATIGGVAVRPPRTSRLKKGGVEFSVRGKRSDTENE